MSGMASCFVSALGQLLFALAIKRRVELEIAQRAQGLVYATRCPHCGHDGLPLHEGRRHTCPVCDCLLSVDYSTEGVVYRSGALKPGATRIEADCASGLVAASFLTAMQAFEDSSKAAASLREIKGCFDGSSSTHNK